MKKSIKVISLFILSLIMIFIGRESVYAADNSPSSFTAVSSKMKNKPKGLETNDISIKKTTDGKYIYCYDVNDKVPNGINYTRKSIVTDPIINYIVAQGFTQDNNESEFFSTQATLWMYLLEKGKMKDTQYGYVNKIKTAMKTYPNDAIYSRISRIVADSKKYGEITMADVEIGSSNVSFTLKNGYYVSNLIKVNKASGNYEVALKGAPTGSKVEKTTGGFIVSVPEKSVTKTISFAADVTSNKYVTYIYSPNKAGYQDMLSAYSVKTSDSINLSIKKVVEQKPTLAPTIVVISKQDTNNKIKELPGATLVIKNSKGVEVERWVSGTKPVTFTDLPVGSYTLSELKAPEGYKLSNEVVKFNVQLDGKYTSIVLYNIPEEKLDNTIIKISKQDITNKGSELPGATLVIKDNKGEIVEQWVSGAEAKTFANLPVGKYTLTETIAPKGFELSEETITFEVKEDGKIETVTMYNTPEKIEETVVKISKQDITTKKELEGATLVIKDSNGKELYKWVSEKEPYVIKGLEEGTYTLTEIQAPNGYILSEEVITFVVENNGKVNNVVMFNTPEVTEIVEVPSTGAFASSLPYIIGGLVIMIGSVLIYKNAKKEQ